MTKSLALGMFKACLVSGSVLFCLFSDNGGVQAGDWSIEAKSTSKIDLNDNYYLLPATDGFVFGSYSNVGVDIIHKSAIDRFDLIGDLGYQTYLGTVHTNTQNRLFPRISAKYHLDGKTDSIDLGAGYSFSDLNALDSIDTIGISRDLTRHAFSANAAYSKTLTPRLSLGSSVSIQDIVFSGPGVGVNPYTTTNLSSFFKYRLTKTTDFTTTFGGQWQSVDDAQNTLNSAYFFRSDLSSQLEKNLSVSIGGGPRFGVNYFDNLLIPLNPRISTSTLGWLADAKLNYKYKLGSITAAVSHSVDPDVLGNLQSRDTFSLAASHAINEDSAFDVSAQYRFSTDSMAVGQHSFVFAPVYRHRLAREWSMAAGYTFTWTDSVAGSARSDDLFLSLSKNFVVMP
jgi:hypothetical protein